MAGLTDRFCSDISQMVRKRLVGKGLGWPAFRTGWEEVDKTEDVKEG